MLRVLFICHGNICRSPAAEFVFRGMAEKAGIAEAFEISSAATSSEELGNPVYPPMRRVLSAQGIDCAGKTAHRVTDEEYAAADLVVTMDEENMYMLRRRFGASNKTHMLMEFAGLIGAEVSDPWYTRDFEGSLRDIVKGCEGLMEAVSVIDFSECETKSELFKVLHREMRWADWYGENLDALHDIVTGLPHKGKFFAVIPPKNKALVSYCEMIEDILNSRL